MSDAIEQRIAAIVGRAQAFGGMEALNAEDLAETIAEELGLDLETQVNVPISIPEVDEHWEPVMCPNCVNPEQKHRFEWVNRQRWATAWEETSGRVTSEQMSARCEARMAEVAAKYESNRLSGNLAAGGEFNA